MHFGLVAVKAEVAQLIDASTAVWPTFELAGTATLAGFDARRPWRIAKQRVVTSQDWSLHEPGTDEHQAMTAARKRASRPWWRLGWTCRSRALSAPAA